MRCLKCLLLSKFHICFAVILSFQGTEFILSVGSFSLLSETVCNASEVEKLREKGFTERIIKSLCILVENTDYKDEKQLKKLKSDYNAEKILKYKNDGI